MQEYHKVWLDSHPEYDDEWLIKATSAGFDIHHIDGDHSNNDPDNLLLIEKRDHMKLHGRSPFLSKTPRERWECLEHRAIMGKEAYLMRERGEKWVDIGMALYEADGRPYRKENNAAKAINTAKMYAKYHKKIWPIPHLASCDCTYCKKGLKNSG